MKTSGYKHLGLMFVFASIMLSGVPSTPAQETTRKVLKRVEPQYPSVLRKRGIGGVVRLRVVVKADGTVRDMEVVGGNPILADSAQKAVKHWVFAPEALDSTVEVTVVFNPTSAPDN